MDRRTKLRGIAIAAWATLCAAGLAGLAEAASAPGQPALTAPRRWPADSTIPHVAGRPTLLMFAHTKCACTRASMRELERLLARSRARVDAHVVFSGPRDTGDFLSLRAMARAIPGLDVVDDERETERFGALTSGQVLVYDGDRELVFRGGITSARGHEGESVGNRAVLSVALGGPSSGDAPKSSAVFGCALFSPSQTNQSNP